MAEATLENYIPACRDSETALAVIKRYANNHEDNFKHGRCLVMFGNCGTGKTHLAIALLKAIMHDHKTESRYSTAAGICREVKETFGSADGRSEQEVIRDYARHPFLVIDEVGAQYGTATELVILESVIMRRYDEYKPTILISNTDEVGLKAYIGERSMDRLYENGGMFIPFTWESKRRR